MCHVGTLITAPAGTVLNGGAYVVSEALGSKIIHPFSDFLLHDVGTGDGILQAGPAIHQFRLEFREGADRPLHEVALGPADFARAVEATTRRRSKPATGPSRL